MQECCFRKWTPESETQSPVQLAKTQTSRTVKNTFLSASEYSYSGCYTENGKKGGKTDMERRDVKTGQVTGGGSLEMAVGMEGKGT